MAEVGLVLATSSGGVGQHIRSLARHLVAAGHVVRIAGPAATEKLFQFTDSGATFTPVEISATPNPITDTRAIFALRRATRGLDVVHAHGLRAGLIAALARRLPSPLRPLRLPLIVTWHNLLLPPDAGFVRHYVLTVLEKVVARSADVTLGASEDLVARAWQLGSADARFAPVAAPPLTPATREPRQVRQELSEELGLDLTVRPLILSVGRLHPQKNFPLLIEAAARWRHRNPMPLVLVAGDGPQEAELRALAERASAPITFLGRRDDVADLLVASDIAVVTSVWEARQLFAQEALRAGRPLVATAVGGMPGLVGSGGVLIPPSDVDALDTAVVTLLNDPMAANAVAQRGKQQAAAWPSEEDTAAQVAAVYAELIGRTT